MARKKKPEPKKPAEPFKYSTRGTLYPGDVFRCSGGPYYLTKDDRKVSMGERGLFQYIDKLEDGILAFPHGEKMARSAFIYMGEEKLSELTGTYLRPHKIRKIRKKK
jgi:hypothetical protein